VEALACLVGRSQTTRGQSSMPTQFYGRAGASRSAPDRPGRRTFEDHRRRPPTDKAGVNLIPGVRCRCFQRKLRRPTTFFVAAVERAEGRVVRVLIWPYRTWDPRPVRGGSAGLWPAELGRRAGPMGRRCRCRNGSENWEFTAFMNRGWSMQAWTGGEPHARGERRHRAPKTPATNPQKRFIRLPEGDQTFGVRDTRVLSFRWLVAPANRFMDNHWSRTLFTPGVSSPVPNAQKASHSAGPDLEFRYGFRMYEFPQNFITSPDRNLGEPARGTTCWQIGAKRGPDFCAASPWG